jgi:hypothetical protein
LDSFLEGLPETLAVDGKYVKETIVCPSVLLFGFRMQRREDAEFKGASPIN